MNPTEESKKDGKDSENSTPEGERPYTLRDFANACIGVFDPEDGEELQRIIEEGRRAGRR